MGWRRILSRECPFNILSCAVTFSINRCHNKGMPLLPNHNSTLVNRPQDRRHLKLWHEYPSTRLILPISERGGAAWGLAAKIPEAIYQTPVGANLKEKNISFEMKITEQFFGKSKYKLNFFLHCWQLQCKWLVWGRHWQHLKGNEQNSPLEGKKRKEIFEKNE